MKLYWPMAHYKDSNGEQQTAFTTDGYFTLSRAICQISLWEKHYKYDITEAWIDVTNDDTDKIHVKLKKVWVVDE